jgi:type IV fimbrial biogenesis protein FimT
MPAIRAFMPAASRTRCRGFTLVELLVAAAIVATLLAAGTPAFYEWLGAYELANQAKHLAETMTRARTEAIRTNHRVSVCKSPDQRQCADGGSWEQGFVVFVDENGNGRVDAGERILEIDGRSARGITITANRPVDDYVSYTSLGSARMLSGALQMGTFTLCRRGQRQMHVVLANSGRVRTERTTSICP